MLPDTVDSASAGDRWLLAQLSKSARTLPASFYRRDVVAPYFRFSPRLFGPSTL